MTYSELLPYFAYLPWALGVAGLCLVALYLLRWQDYVTALRQLKREAREEAENELRESQSRSGRSDDDFVQPSRSATETVESKSSRQAKLRLAVFASGNGTNAENLIRHFQSPGKTNAEVVLLVINRKAAYAAERARNLGVPVAYLPKEAWTDGKDVVELMREHDVDFIVLAGFLAHIPDAVLEAFPKRIVNIHPSLLPRHGGKGMYGSHVHEAVLAAGESESGITIHYVNQDYDAGAIIFQARCPVLPDDTPESLAHRVHDLEYAYFPEVVEKTLKTTSTEQADDFTHLAQSLGSTSAGRALPRVSIVVPTCNQAEALARNLPRLLTQVYPGRFEVVVADQISEDETPTLLARLSQRFPNLRQTFVPASGRHIELRKLALTLGIRAARAEWVVVVNPQDRPTSDEWLRTLAAHIDDETDFLQAYINYDDDYTSAARRPIYERLRRQVARHRAFRLGKITGCETSHFAVRKSWFLEEQGFADSLNLPFGEETIFANRHGRAPRTKFVFSPTVRLVEELPPKFVLRALRVERAETLRHLSPFARFFAGKEGWATLAAHLGAWILFIYIVLRFSADWPTQSYNLRAVYADTTALVLLLAFICTPMVLMQKLCKRLNERPFSYYIFVHTFLQPFRAFAIGCRRFARRSAFVRKF